MSVKYTSYDKAWCDKVEAALKEQGAKTARATETTYQLTEMDGKVLSQVRGSVPAFEQGKVRKALTLYIVESNTELVP